MKLIATKDFTAHMDGEVMTLSKGEPFKGTPKVADQLLASGLLEKPVKGEPFKGTPKVADQLLASGLLEKPVKKPTERKEKND